jgi:molybdate transport system substrate-binding protein
VGRRLAAVALLLVTAACGGGGGGSESKLTVLAAASLTKALDGADARYSFAGSQQLAAQVEAGAPADVVVTADAATMDRLARAKRVEGSTTVAHNSLAIAVRPGNPKGISGLGDLAHPDLTVVLADPGVPAGRYAKQALAAAHVEVHPKSLELDVESALQKVALGQADAAIVYATDVQARADAATSPSVTGVAIPARQNVLATYVGAVVAKSKHKAQARRFLEALPGRLAKAGFEP